MKKLLILVMACYGLNARSQENESNNFLYLYSDSKVYAKHIRLQPDFSGFWSFRVDGRRIPAEQVKFFSNEDGFFANNRKVDLFNQVSFSERIISGRINLFQEVNYDPIPFEYDFYRFRPRVQQAVNSRMFYNKEFSDLKKVNYYNLTRDLADNPQSIDFLNEYRKRKRTGTAMYVGAGAAIIAGAITLFSGFGFSQNGFSDGDMPYSRNKTGSFLLMGLGTGLGIGGYLIEASGSRNIENAIDSYNR